ncbi:proline--tRNA ligase [Halobacteriales archaeon QH_7_65_31]|nr:MAG: proline--tRNA ligase [Halobacteriales archaeon QH_7_65_31]
MSDADEADEGSEQSLGITKRKEYETGEWYAEVVQKADLADYAPTGGFIVVKPRGYTLWEQVQARLDGWFDATGVENAYFPMMIPESYLERESDIVEGFDPEVAWVTHGGHEELEERLAIRPTSESIITPYMAEWTRSHRDLPLRLNQWCSVVRWEATDTKPFFRTKEFLWQEGHTAHESEAEAWAETMTRLEQYSRLYEDVLAMPTTLGRKPDHDKFPGGETTTTVEALMPDGKSLQAGTSHYLGTGFADAYDLTYRDENEDEQVCHTTSWGLSWRALGGLIMTHSDDQGLVLPPTIAPEQVVIVPIWQAESREAVLDYCEQLYAELDAAGVRTVLDDRDERNPGFKFNEWELKGTPLRIEIGPNEVRDEEITLVHRPDGETETAARDDLVDATEDALDTVYAKLYADAEENLEANIREAHGRSEILGTLGQHGGYVKTGWCGDEACETEIKDQIAAEIVMLPLEADTEPVHDSCGVCGDPAAETAFFAKNY